MTLDEAKERIQENLERSREDVDIYCDDGSRGEVTAYENALSILKQIDTEPAQKDKMTLTELANELRKLFKFKYLTVSPKTIWRDDCIGLDIFINKPWFSAKDRHWVDMEFFTRGMLVIPESLLEINLDLSEYKDENGEIDYSKSIVSME